MRTRNLILTLAVFISIAIFSSIFLTSCGNPNYAVIASLSARRIGCMVGQSDDANVDRYIKACDTLLGLEDEAQLRELALNTIEDILNETGDPLIVEDMKDLLTLFGVDASLPQMPGLDKIPIEDLKRVASSFQYGISKCSEAVQ
jgi:hypothetical protein